MSASIEKQASESDHDLKNKDIEHYVEPVGVSDAVVPRTKFRSLWAIVDKLDAYGVEAQGIERVPPDARPQKSPLAPFWLWLAANMTTSTFSLGTLASSIFYLGLREACLVILFFNLLCTIPVAYFSTWGPKLGLRQLTISRFSFGYFTSLVPIVLNCIACVGWSVVNSIVGAQTLRAVSDSHQIPTAAAIIVIAIGTIAVSFMGYRVVHLYEMYSWIPVAIIFIIYLGQIARFADAGPWGGTGAVEAGNVLSFGAAVAGFALGWTSIAADYTVRMPEDMPAIKIFFWTYLGLNIPLILVECLGAAAMTTLTAKTTWADAYDASSVGGLLGAGLTGPMGGFGRFLLVILSLSIIANNIPNIYSLALTFQNIHPYAQAIPRVFIVIVGSVVYIVLAIVGASHFEEWLDTLLTILSYWLAIFVTILVEEHLIFRRGRWANYDPDHYNNWRKLPLGVASFIALGCGIAGAVLGMAQTWYVGQIARHIGDPIYGGDIGFELSFAFTAVVFPPLRYIEKKYWGY
ncbi:permease for cytosine/purines, uracil, thiamine, allantoin-domain-containing protein [Rhodofomes roseus]|uniref:Permease for cytosine/purines, uracil, thiamine, allantoin-domain-containing protein n=1 Tax=Rhodofomes roseus TaxID=34475 RepID=A0ABQ8KXY1_9APHY|nr:permease for cytosine/purines, uracil, thiamine, allantoin-domain-containing protein [Rhodofomes roseus]KAH9844159.1 permease for cytosine/purines, uracil, thiamine, allantoin-domain-containing protein [Rhodofomes roseus]